MILAIDHLAYRYKMLPSQVLSQATTFDLYVSDVAVRFQNKNTNPSKVPELTQEQMKQMIQSVKDKKRANR